MGIPAPSLLCQEKLKTCFLAVKQPFSLSRVIGLDHLEPQKLQANQNNEIFCVGPSPLSLLNTTTLYDAIKTNRRKNNTREDTREGQRFNTKWIVECLVECLCC
jgi:hypothetical protein